MATKQVIQPKAENIQIVQTQRTIDAARGEFIEPQTDKSIKRWIIVTIDCVCDNNDGRSC
jgi:hypothetical protein